MAKFSKRPPLRDGERISVAYHVSPHFGAAPTAVLSHERAKILGRGRNRRVLAVMALAHITLANEGIVWCRGWIGREVDALRTSVALS